MNEAYYFFSIRPDNELNAIYASTQKAIAEAKKKQDTPWMIPHWETALEVMDRVRNDRKNCKDRHPVTMEVLDQE